MKRKLAWVCLLVSPLLIGGVALFLLDRDPITQANCDRIKKGMTEKEVEDILGSKNDGFIDVGFMDAPYWKGARGKIIVTMTIHEPLLVETAVFDRNVPRDTLEKIRDWLGL